MLPALPISAVPRRFVAVLSTLAVLAGALVAGVAPARAASTELFFSEYIEGSSNNKALEIYNGTGAPINLGTGGYSVQMFFNGNAAAGLTINLTGTVAAGDVFVLAQSSANATILAQADQTNGSGWFNGDDAITLRKGTAVVDSIGQGGVDPGTEWGSGLTSTADNTLHRKAAVEAGDTTATDAFDPAVSWDGLAQDTFYGLGARTGDAAPQVRGSSPADGATGIGRSDNLTVSFSEPVSVTSEAFGITCANSGTHASTASSTGNITWTVDPATDFAFGEQCTVTVFAAHVSDDDTQDPPSQPVADSSFTFTTVDQDPCEADYTPIYELQGSGTATPFPGQTRSTEGVVVGDTQGNSGLNGFFVQDIEGDGDKSTSDGIFVFTPAASPFAGIDLEFGDVVHLTGRVTEFNTLTEIDFVSALKVCGSADAPAPAQVELPEAVDGDLEEVEGMYTAVSGADGAPLTVEQNFFQGRYGQLTLGAGGRLYQPTNEFPAGTPQAVDLADLNKRSMIVLDDGFGGQNPDPVPYLGPNLTRRAGDTVSDLVGVIDFGQINSNSSIRDFRLHPTEAPTFANTNPRPPAPAGVGGTVKVAAVNVLNYFNTFTGCTFGVGGATTDCRGANNATEFDRQEAKIVNEITTLDADVVGLMEIENDGYGPTSAVQSLVDALNAKVGADTYSFVDVDTATNQVNAAGTDAIRVAMLYRGARVEKVGQTAVLNTGAFGQYTLQDGSTIGRHRPAIAQAFQDSESGERIVVTVNHFKSKGSGCADNASPVPSDPDTGDGQGNCNLTRVAAAEELTEWLAGDPTASGDEDALIIGDLNSYAKEDPILAIEDAGYTDLIEEFVGDDAYSYIFDGMSGYLDHALGTNSVVDQVTGVTEWHTNADEPSVLDYNTEFKTAGQVTGLYSPLPFRASDHDPVLVGLELGPCSFTDDTDNQVRHLDGDCSTSETVLVRDGWTLDGDGHTISAYDPVGGHFVGAVVANEGDSASVRNLTVTTYDLADVCDNGDNRLRGILLDGATGTVEDNEVIGIRQAGSGCQEGNAIEVRNAPFDTTGPDKAVTIRDNVVDDYQKTGILVNGSVDATVTGNDVSGLGPVSYIAQNGVQIGFGATAIVDGNRLADNWYTGSADAISCGLLLFEADGVKQMRNVFVANQQDLCNFGRGGGSPAH